MAKHLNWSKVCGIVYKMLKLCKNYSSLITCTKINKYTTSFAKQWKVVCYVVPFKPDLSPSNQASLPGTRLISGLYPSFTIPAHYFTTNPSLHIFCRLEIWYILGRRDFRHRINTTHVERRAHNFKLMYKHVSTERATNAKSAWNVRRAQLHLDDGVLQDNTAVRHGGINFDDLDSF